MNVSYTRLALQCQRDVHPGSEFLDLRKVRTDKTMKPQSGFQKGRADFSLNTHFQCSIRLSLRQSQRFFGKPQPSYSLRGSTVSQYWRVLERWYWNHYAAGRYVYPRMHVLCRQHQFETASTGSFRTIQGRQWIYMYKTAQSILFFSRDDHHIL